MRGTCFLSEEISFLLNWDSNNEYSVVILQCSAICIKFMHFKLAWLCIPLIYKSSPLGNSRRIVNLDAKIVMRGKCKILTPTLFWTAILLTTQLDTAIFFIQSNFHSKWILMFWERAAAGVWFLYKPANNNGQFVLRVASVIVGCCGLLFFFGVEFDPESRVYVGSCWVTLPNRLLFMTVERGWDSISRKDKRY